MNQTLMRPSYYGQVPASWFAACVAIEVQWLMAVGDDAEHTRHRNEVNAILHGLDEVEGLHTGITILDPSHFCILRVLIKDQNSWYALGKRLANFISIALQGGQDQKLVAVKVGIAPHANDIIPSAATQHAALDALHKASHHKTISFYIATPIGSEKGGGDSYSMAKELEDCLSRHELSLVYQPQVRLADNSLMGFECLLRWDSPRFGHVLPEIFVPLLERSGQIKAVGAWALQTACNQLSAWRSHSGKDLTMAINVSALQLDENIAKHIQHALKVAELPAHALEIELTESAVVTYPAAIVAIKDLGVRIAVDDFGTGCTGLSYLVSLPLDTLKIDRFFIKELGYIDKHTQIVIAMVSMAHQLGLTVVAEGIENETVCNATLQLGCDAGQGYWFSRPLTSMEALAFILRSELH